MLPTIQANDLSMLPVNYHAGIYSGNLLKIIDFLLVVLQNSPNHSPRAIFIRALFNDWFYFTADTQTDEITRHEIHEKLRPFNDEFCDGFQAA